MNPYQFPVECIVCGETGYAKMSDMWKFTAHKDPRICSENLKRRKRVLDAAKNRNELEYNG